MASWIRWIVFTAMLGLLAACAPPARHDPDQGARIIVLSTDPLLVSGSDVRIAVASPRGRLDELTFWLNGKQIQPPMMRRGRLLEGVVSGLALGRNLLEVRRAGGAVLDSVVLVNHPITGPIFTGPQQQPFICRTEESGLGQPLVDNHDGIGHPVFDRATGRLIGHSRYCAIETRFLYVYFNGSGFRPFDPARDFDTPPADLRTTPVNGVQLPFVVRVEIGTINRFIYTIAMLAPYREGSGDPRQLNNAAWNEKLVYWLRGGIGIGHQQGLALWTNNRLGSAERVLFPPMLAQGYAIASSSGNETGVHYNLRLAEETALMTKEHFIEQYGKPRYTIGLGGSGGAVQQYAFAQNRPGLIDGGVPIQSFPDIITQTMPVLDCPLLEQYFAEAVARDPASPWARWSKRRLVEGMNASDTVPNAITGTPGSTECINGWWTVVPTMLNPRYKDPEYDLRARQYGYPPDVFANVKWTYWNDLANIYGTDSQGYAKDSYDNVGVQYGLQALVDGQIGADEFLRINACVGGWKAQPEFVQWEPQLDPFDSRNMRRSSDCPDPAGTPAPRRRGDPETIRRAFASGQVFTGRRLGIPMIDLRPYLEPQLNMHESRQSFSIRARLLAKNAHGAADQAIWFTGSEADLLPKALDALTTIDRTLATGTRPAAFTDRCFGAGGALIGEGPGAWSGILDHAPPGICTATYPIYSSPRMVAGESIAGLTFQCARKSVSRALRDGTYGGVRFEPQQRAWLGRIFPDGVCDYGNRQPPPAALAYLY